jgi:flagellar protein FlbD
MISLTRLSGSVFFLNADLIERLDSTPDTVVTLVDGKKYVVTETMEEVVEAIQAYRGAVIAHSALIGAPEAQPSRLHLAPVTQHPASIEEAD